jgi:hypothetical protein
MILRDKKSKSINLYRPKGCDLFKLLKKNEIIDDDLRLFFLKSNKAKGGELFNLTKAYIFLTRLAWGEINQRYFREDLRYVNLSSQGLDQVIGKGSERTKVIDLLVELEVIEVNHAYSTDRFSKSYRLADRWATNGRELVPPPYFISEAKQKFFGRQTEPRCDPEGDTDNYLLGCLRRITLDSKVDNYIDNERQYRNDDGRKYARDYIDAIREFDSGLIQFARATRTSRLNTVITRIHRDARHFLLLDGLPCWEVDMVASQPFFMTQLLKHQPQEQERWLSLWNEGDFYDAMRPLIGNSNTTREGIKRAIIQGGLNAKNPHRAPVAVRGVAIEVWKAIAANFPALAREINTLKTVRDEKSFPKLEVDDKGQPKVYSQFALKLQGIEAKIFIDGACSLLMKSRIPIYTVHDAIGCKAEHVDEVKEAIAKATKEVIGFTPRLTAKRPQIQGQDAAKFAH